MRGAHVLQPILEHGFSVGEPCCEPHLLNVHVRHLSGQMFRTFSEILYDPRLVLSCTRVSEEDTVVVRMARAQAAPYFLTPFDMILAISFSFSST